MMLSIANPPQKRSGHSGRRATGDGTNAQWEVHGLVAFFVHQPQFHARFIAQFAGGHGNGPGRSGGEGPPHHTGPGAAEHPGRPVATRRFRQGGKSEAALREPGARPVHREPDVGLIGVPVHQSQCGQKEVIFYSQSTHRYWKPKTFSNMPSRSR